MNKPSQDLLGLTLHEISDPIDAPVTSSFANNAQEGEPQSDTPNNIFDMSKDSETENQCDASDTGTLCNTSKGKCFHPGTLLHGGSNFFFILFCLGTVIEKM